jgi:hypothetical protein
VAVLEIREIILARSVQIFRSSGGTVGYLPDIANQLKERYQFIKAPSVEELLPSDPPKGAEFHHGRLPDDPNVVIDKFTVFSDGIVVDAAGTTDHADRFLEDLQTWAKQVLPKVSVTAPRLYLSQLVIKMEPSLSRFAPLLSPIGTRIGTYLHSYGLNVPSYDISTITMNFDSLGKPPPVPGQFFIDRRLNVSYEENIWFSQAPLRTSDHIALLDKLTEL